MDSKIRALMIFALLAAVSGCHKNTEIVEVQKGLEDQKVFESASVQESIGTLLEGLRLVSHPTERAYAAANIVAISEEILASCALTKTEKEGEQSIVEISASEAKPDCLLEFREERQARTSNQGTGRNQVSAVEIQLNIVEAVAVPAPSPSPAPAVPSAANQLLQETISATKIKALTLAGMRIEDLTSAGSLSKVTEDLSGQLETTTGKNTGISLRENSKLARTAGIATRTQGLGMTTNLSGKAANVSRNRVIKNGQLISETITVNGRKPTDGELEKLKAASK
jgi:hypothetical protein